MLKQVAKRLAEQNIKMEIDDSVKELIAKKGIDQSFGARPLRRSIQNLVEDKIAEAILDGKIKSGSVALISAKDGEVEIKTKNK